LGLLCLIQTDSRSGWLAAAFGFLVFAYTHLKESAVKRLIPWGVLTVLLVTMAIGLFTHSGQGRFMIWAESLGIWKTHPLGVGLENYNIHQLEAQRDFFQDPAHLGRYLQNASFTFDSHDEPLNILVETGPFGLLGWLALVGFTAWRGFRKAAKAEEARAWLAAWSGMLFFSLWNTVLFYAPLGFLFWMEAGFLTTLDGPAKPEKRTSPIIKWSLTLLFVALALECALDGVRTTRAAWYEHQGDILLSTGPFDEDARLYRQALALDPDNGFTWQKLGLALYFDQRYPEALDCLAKAAPLYGDVAVPYLQAEILAREKRYPEAIEKYLFISGAFPNHVTPPFMLGQIYLKLGEKDKAREQFQRVLDIPESPYNLRLDRRKVEKQKTLAKEFLDGIQVKARQGE
jgi:tetratricopeptide (TPR) repeat protein